MNTEKLKALDFLGIGSFVFFSMISAEMSILLRYL